MLIQEQRHRSNSGFTLTELIVALAMFSIISVAIVNTIGLSQGSQRNERYLDLANTTAKQLIEEARNGQYATLVGSTSGVTYDRSSEVPAELPSGTASLVVTQTSAMPDFKRIDVTVGYMVGSVSHQVNESAIIGQGGITE